MPSFEQNMQNQRERLERLAKQLDQCHGGEDAANLLANYESMFNENPIPHISAALHHYLKKEPAHEG